MFTFWNVKKQVSEFKYNVKNARIKLFDSFLTRINVPLNELLVY